MTYRLRPFDIVPFFHLFHLQNSWFVDRHDCPSWCVYANAVSLVDLVQLDVPSTVVQFLDPYPSWLFRNEKPRSPLVTLSSPLYSRIYIPLTTTYTLTNVLSPLRDNFPGAYPRLLLLYIPSSR